MVSLQQRSPLLRRSIQFLRILSLGTFGTSAFLLGSWLSYAEVLKISDSQVSINPALSTSLIPGLASYDFSQIEPVSPPASGSTALEARQIKPITRQLAGQFAGRAIALTPPAPNSVAQPQYHTPLRNPGHSIPQAFRGKVIRRVGVGANQKVVALTFDDGPWKNQTEKVLAILEEFNVRATFFVTGRQVRQWPGLTRRIVAEGHTIGNHTWNHPTHQVDAKRAIREVEETRRMIQQATGIRPVLYRPPGGNLHTRMVGYVLQQDEAVVMWSIDTKDYYAHSDSITQTVLNQVKPGAIVLLHDGGGDRTATIQSLAPIIATLQQRGYRFVTVPELLQMQRKGGKS